MASGVIRSSSRPKSRSRCLANGELFESVLAFSPALSLPPETDGTLFVSHAWDEGAVLPIIDRTSRRIVPRLERVDEEVRYGAFEGPHTVPGEMVRDGFDWLVR